MSNRSIKYLLIGIVTFLAIRYIPTHALLDKEIIVISIVVSIAYAIIDKLLPSYKL
jgi:hypothetical protein